MITSLFTVLGPLRRTPSGQVRILSPRSQSLVHSPRSENTCRTQRHLTQRKKSRWHDFGHAGRGPLPRRACGGRGGPPASLRAALGPSRRSCPRPRRGPERRQAVDAGRAGGRALPQPPRVPGAAPWRPSAVRAAEGGVPSARRPQPRLGGAPLPTPLGPFSLCDQLWVRGHASPGPSRLGLGPGLRSSPPRLLRRPHTQTRLWPEEPACGFPRRDLLASVDTQPTPPQTPHPRPVAQATRIYGPLPMCRRGAAQAVSPVPARCSGGGVDEAVAPGRTRCRTRGCAWRPVRGPLPAPAPSSPALLPAAAPSLRTPSSSPCSPRVAPLPPAPSAPQSLAKWPRSHPFFGRGDLHTDHSPTRIFSSAPSREPHALTANGRLHADVTKARQVTLCHVPGGNDCSLPALGTSVRSPGWGSFLRTPLPSSGACTSLRILPPKHLLPPPFFPWPGPLSLLPPRTPAPGGQLSPAHTGLGSPQL